MEGPLPTDSLQALKGLTGRIAIGGDVNTRAHSRCPGVKGVLEEAVGSKKAEGSGLGEKSRMSQRPVDRDLASVIPFVVIHSGSGPPKSSNLPSPTRCVCGVSFIQLFQLQTALLITGSTPDLTAPASATTESFLSLSLFHLYPSQGKKDIASKKEAFQEKGG